MFERAQMVLRFARVLPRMVRLRPQARQTVPDLLEARAASHPRRPFVRFEERAWSYGELNEAANRVAHWAHGLGLTRGDVVALVMENRPEYVAIWMGLAKVGVTTALINTNLTGRALTHALETAGARHLVLGSDCADRFATVGDELEDLEIWLDRDPVPPGEEHAPPAGARDLVAALSDQPHTNPAERLRSDVRCGDDVFYIYTSGTTGLPKAARFSHLRFLGAGYAAAAALGLGPHDVHYCALPLYHSAGGMMLVSSVLAAGATMALRRKFSARHFWDDVRRYDATAFQYIGEFCRYLMNQPPSKDDRDHAVRIATGNGLRPDIWEAFQERFGIPRILEFYGATEGNIALMNFDGKVGSVGRFPLRALSNARLIRYDIDADEHPREAHGFCFECEPDEIGELIGKIPPGRDSTLGRFEGYTSEDATEKKILRDVFEKGDAWFRSGDLLRQDAQGFFYFIDRIGDTFRWKGENVSTQEVAEVLSGFPGVEMVNVYGVEVPGADGRAGMAAVLLENPDAFDGEALYGFVDGSLPRYATPIFVRLLLEVEVTGTFKLRKVTLQEQGWDLERVSDPLYLRDDAARAYVPLTRERVEEIRSGQRKL
jgi:fatty-acyl-CoA synthase